MQPLYAKNINWRYPPVAVQGTIPQKYIPQALGWQPRYSEYKTALDLNHGQFAKGEPPFLIGLSLALVTLVSALNLIYQV